MDLSLHACQGCPKAISNRVKNGNWLVFVPCTRWRTNFCAKQACLTVPTCPKVPQSPLCEENSSPNAGMLQTAWSEYKHENMCVGPQMHMDMTSSFGLVQCWTGIIDGGPTLYQRDRQVGFPHQRPWYTPPHSVDRSRSQTLPRLVFLASKHRPLGSGTSSSAVNHSSQNFTMLTICWSVASQFPLSPPGGWYLQTPARILLCKHMFFFQYTDVSVNISVNACGSKMLGLAKVVVAVTFITQYSSLFKGQWKKIAD